MSKLWLTIEERGITWPQMNDSSYNGNTIVGVYTVTVRAYAECERSVVKFTLTVIECTPLDIGAANWLNEVYGISTPSKTLQRPAATGVAECGISYLLTMTDSSSIDTAIFQSIDLVSSTKTILIQSTDVTKIATYDFTITVSYDNVLNVVDTTTFQVDVVAFSVICPTSTLDVDSTIWQDDNYYIGDPTKSLPWTPASTGDVVACGSVSWWLSVAGGSIDASVFTNDFSTATKTLDIFTNDSGKAGTYEFTVTVYYDNEPSVSDYTTF